MEHYAAMVGNYKYSPRLRMVPSSFCGHRWPESQEKEQDDMTEGRKHLVIRLPNAEIDPFRVSAKIPAPTLIVLALAVSVAQMNSALVFFCLG